MEKENAVLENIVFIFYVRGLKGEFPQVWLDLKKGTIIFDTFERKRPISSEEIKLALVQNDIKIPFEELKNIIKVHHWKEYLKKWLEPINEWLEKG